MEKRKGTGGDSNAMVKSEIEAAEALAGLAGQEVTRLRDQTESLLPQHDFVSDQTADLRLSSDSTDEAVGAQRRCENIYTISVNKRNIDRDTQLHKSSVTCSKSHTFISRSKSRQKIPEDEKEARRIRRVLANRESARQTIRRRQALYEELINKAASLTEENESVKREMDLAVQEFECLMTTNRSLKLQMVKAVSTELDENQPDAKLTNTETANSTCPSCPFFVYNQTSPFPFMWPTFVQPPNATQTLNGINLFPEQANFENKNVLNPPLYILPCPIFYGTGVPFMSYLNSKNEQNQNEQTIAPMSNAYACGSSTKTVWYGFEEWKAENSLSKPTSDMSFKIQTGPPVLVKPIASVKPVTTPQSEFISSTNNLSMSREKKLELNVCSSKKQGDAVAAAEARKRRKEITKLKSLHVRDSGRG